MRPIEVRELPVEGVSTVRVPFVGAALCVGFPSPADDWIEGALELPRWLVPNPLASFLWRVAGWSAIGAGIYDGDLIVVDRSLTPIREDIVVVAIDGEMSLKRYRIEGNRPMLAFDNPDLPAAPLDEIGEAAVWGVASVNLRLLRPLLRRERPDRGRRWPAPSSARRFQLVQLLFTPGTSRLRFSSKIWTT